MSALKASIHLCTPMLFVALSLLAGGCAVSTPQRVISLNGTWEFAVDAEDAGLEGQWFGKGAVAAKWQPVTVPHTWQVMEGLEDYRGIAWYRRQVSLAPIKESCLLKLEFDAVYRDVQIWVDGKPAGEHKHSGWTPFALLLDSSYAADGQIDIALRVDNWFSEQALPYGSSFDWANDGGIIRGVRLSVLPKIHISRLLVDAEPTDDFSKARVSVRVGVYSEAGGASVEATVLDRSGNAVAEMSGSVSGLGKAALSATIEKPELWHFDKPVLYALVCRLVKGGRVIHEKATRFGIRKVEVRDGYYWLNGEPMRLMGVEWMPGSDPRYGMAESPEYMRGILVDMKKLNCVISRFHWQQDESVFEFCDSEGMLFQEEIPTWGPSTKLERLADVQEQQMNEMILAHYNHASIYAWGLCNEIVGQQQRGHEFVQKGVEIAHSLDPLRLLTYASNTLQSKPERDASRYVDFIEWNDYYDAWYGGGIPELEANLEEIADAFPRKSLVISEYGLCECSPDNPVGDARRIEMMRSHTDVYRKTPQIAGAIYFSYNDYRTHIGDKCTGAFRQRVHGVVDLMGRRKPSWEALRRQASPVKTLAVAEAGDGQFEIELVTRSLENDLPAYTLYDYDLIWTGYNSLGQPVAAGKVRMPRLSPGAEHVEVVEAGDVVKVHAEVFRPTGYSVLDAVWEKPE